MTLIQPLTDRTAKRSYLKKVECIESPCDHCPHRDTCRTGKACERFHHFVESGKISRMHSTMPNVKSYRKVYANRRTQ
ncbi:hypothetical protein [Endozoicomonas sp. ALB091]|uniref:hypothetical protein n=1 Tax=Endozoicomonas sp. ALB091 TaxID=3403073 RepID=UPI003BB5EBE1